MQIGKYLTKVQPSRGKLSVPTNDPRGAKQCHSNSHEGGAGIVKYTPSLPELCNLASKIWLKKLVFQDEPKRPPVALEPAHVLWRPKMDRMRFWRRCLILFPELDGFVSLASN
jgi:hypothetical protein